MSDSGVKALTIAEAAERMGFSRQTATRIFEREPGVIAIKHPEVMHKRSYRSLRIPPAVFERVMRKMSVCA